MTNSDYEADFRDKLRPLCEVIAFRISDLVGGFIKDADIPVAQIEHRAKSVSSFVEKAKAKGYVDPLSEITDLAGIRVVTYYNDDVDKVAEIIRAQFTVDDKQSSDKLETLDVDEFGYRSFHLVCKLREPRSSLAEWRSYREFWFEIQIRSVLQHAWAAISHKLDYKSASQAPREVRRQLFRLSALLELADDEFRAIRLRTEALAEEYRADVERGNLSLPLNRDSLAQYLLTHVQLDEWRKLGLDVGMMSFPWVGYSDAQLSNHFRVLEALGIESLGELDSLVQKHRKMLTLFSKN